MSSVTFDCNGRYAPAYTCNKPGDNSGEYVSADVAQELYEALRRIVDDLPINRDWLDPVAERAARDALARYNSLDPSSMDECLSESKKPSPSSSKDFK